MRAWWTNVFRIYSDSWKVLNSYLLFWTNCFAEFLDVRNLCHSDPPLMTRRIRYLLHHLCLIKPTNQRCRSSPLNPLKPNHLKDICCSVLLCGENTTDLLSDPFKDLILHKVQRTVWSGSGLVELCCGLWMTVEADRVWASVDGNQSGWRMWWSSGRLM